MTGFIGLRPKCYAFKIHGDGKEYNARALQRTQ